MARSKKKPVSRSRVAALLVIVVLVAAAGAGIVRIYGSRLPEQEPGAGGPDPADRKAE